MSNPILPEDINNISSDFLFQRELYVGLGADQFNVRARFAAADQLLAQIQASQSSAGTSITGLTTRVSTLETNQARISNDLSGVTNTLTEHVGNADIHVTNTIRNHPGNTAVHVPAGGLPNEVLATGTDGLFWTTVMSLLPADLQAIIDNGGNVTPEQVIEAFRQITVSVWESGGLPLGADRITSSVFAGDRFVVGGQSGRVNYTFDASTWQKAVSLFTDPLPAVSVESIAYGKTTADEVILVALDAYSDFRISMDKSTWCPRLSVRVTTNSDGTYADRYETADFTYTLADRGLVLLFTSKGTVYRATYDDVIAEYERAMEAVGPTAEVSEEFDRHSTIWQMQLSQESITAGVLAAASGGGHYVTVGTLGRIAVSNAAVQWESVVGPFGSANLNSIAAGPDKFVTVGDDGKAGYAPLGDPTRWTLLANTPFGTEKLTYVCYGGGQWVVVSASGKAWASPTGIAWKEIPANMVFGGTTIAFGDTYFIVGDTNGNIYRSMSVAAIFSVVTRAEFAALAQQITDATEAQIERMWQEWLILKQDVEDALAKQLTLGTTPGLSSVIGGSTGTFETPLLDDDGEPILGEDGKRCRKDARWPVRRKP